jgi:hypothetical protein
MGDKMGPVFRVFALMPVKARLFVQIFWQAGGLKCCLGPKHAFSGTASEAVFL